jgi:LysR family transcriptional regulator, nitrogen assimilation regulatory protein
MGLDQETSAEARELGVMTGPSKTATSLGFTYDVLKHAKRILGEIEEIRACASDIDRPLTGHIAIGLPPTVAEIISLPLVAAFRKAHPNAVLRLVSAYTGYLLDWLHRGEIDLAVLYDPLSARSLKSEPLLLEDLFLIGPRNTGFSPTRAKPFRALAGQRLLLPSLSTGCAISSNVAPSKRVSRSMSPWKRTPSRPSRTS